MSKMSEEMQKLFEDVNGKRVEAPRPLGIQLAVSDDEEKIGDIFRDVADILMSYGYHMMVITDLEKHETNLFGYRE